MTVHRIDIRIYYEDTDFSGIVYHANYLKYFERGRTEALRSHGHEHSVLFDAEDPISFAVRDISVEYRHPAKIDDMLRIETELTVAKGARLVFRQTAFRGDTVLTTADVTVACLDAKGRPRRLRPDIANALRP